MDYFRSSTKEWYNVQAHFEVESNSQSRFIDTVVTSLTTMTLTVLLRTCVYTVNGGVCKPSDPFLTKQYFGKQV